jgi:hypothetical protein
MKNKEKTKEKALCPKCKSKSILSIINEYGGRETHNKLKQTKVIDSDYRIKVEDRSCISCGNQWYHACSVV